MQPAEGINLIYILLSTSGLLLLANAGLTVFIIFKLRGRGLDAKDRRDNRPFIAGWRYQDLRPLMVLWAAVALLFACSACSLLINILTA